MDWLNGAVLVLGGALLWVTLVGPPPSPGTLPDTLSQAAVSHVPQLAALDAHPVDPTSASGAKPMVTAMPRVVRQGTAAVPDQRQIKVPPIATPARPDVAESPAPVGKSGTGFFIGHDGTLLTAAHVVAECRRLQVISRHVPRTWAALAAMNRSQDIALLKIAGVTPPAVLRVAATSPVSQQLLTAGFPASSPQLAPVAVWVGLENQKIPASAGALANSKELLWMSAPEVSHGFSGGPIFDPRLGAVVGLIKGEVDGGYLRLVRDMPTAGVAIGPGVGSIGTFLRRETSALPAGSVAPPGEAGEELVRKATVKVLCWQ